VGWIHLAQEQIQYRTHASSSMNISHKSTYELNCSNTYITNPKPKSNKINNVRITQLRRVRVTTVAVEKQLVWNLTVCVCILALVNGMQVSSFLSRIIVSSAACLALPFFATLSHKRQHFREKATDHNICFDFTYNRCVKKFSY